MQYICCWSILVIKIHWEKIDTTKKNRETLLNKYVSSPEHMAKL
jgi:hypothetical protein